MAQLTNDLSTFLATTPVFDVTQIQSMDVKSPEFKELIIRLTQHVNNQSLAINAKDTGLYDTQEYASGQAYFPTPTVGGASSGLTTPTNRAVYRKVIPWVDALGVQKALPNGATDTVAHGITNIAGFSITRIYGAATDPTHKVYIPLPFISCKLGTIALWSTSTDIVIDCCGFDGTDYTITYVVIEYIKT